MNECGAMKDVSMAGVDDESRMKSFAESLMGMKFRFQEIQCESLVKEGGVFKKFSVLLPAVYLGRSAIEAVPEVRQAVVGEVTTPAEVPAEVSGKVAEPPTSQPPEV